jgi:3-oxoacyl-(acyl-carrier-protein) synthase III
MSAEVKMDSYACLRHMQVYRRPVARIVSVGICLPENEVDNDAIAARVQAPPALKKRMASLLYRTTGARTRRHAPPGTYPSDLALEASRQALRDAGLRADQIDTLIFASTDMDVIEPATANILQHKLGIATVNSFDVTNACNSVLQALNVANSLIQSGAASRVLVASGEVGSHFCNWQVDGMEDLNAKLGGLTLGDAGAAMVLQAADGASGLTEINLISMGEHWSLCHVPENTAWRREGNGSIHGWFYLDMSALADVARDWSARYFRDYSAYRRAALGEKDLLESISWVIPHQISRRFIERIAGSISSRSLDRIVITADRFGNTASTAIPLALRVLMDRGDVRLGSGQEVLFYGAASGFSVGHVRVRL